MKLTIDAKKFSQTLASSLAKPSTIEILGSVRLSTGDDYLTVESSDMNCWRKDNVPAEVKKSGVITVPAVSMSSMLASLSGSLTLESNDTSLGIKSSSGKYSFGLSPSADFPDSEEEPGDSITMDTDVFVDAMKSILSAGLIPNDKTLFCAQCIHLRSRNGEAILEATSGAAYRLQPLYGPYTGRPALITLKAAREVVGLSGELTMITVGNSRITFKSGDSTVSARLVDGKFIDAEVFGLSPEGPWATINKDDLASVLERATLLSTDNDFGVEMEFSEPTVTLSRETQRGSLRESIPFVGKVPDAKIRFDPVRMSKLVRSMPGETIDLSAGVERKPMYLMSQGCIGLMMPMFGTK